MLKRLANGVLRIGASAAHLVLRAWWVVSRPKTFGAHAIALTPEGKLILVKLRYVRGWRLPGGGRSEHEEPVNAALRELREEIGMVSHGEAVPARDFEERPSLKRDTASIVIVRDVVYEPQRWNWEVEQICEADPRSLPPDVAQVTMRWIDPVRALL